MRQQVTKGGTDTIVLGLRVNGRPVSPSSCTYRILWGGTVIDSGTADAGICTPSASVTGTVRQDCVIEWTYTYAGVTSKTVELFDVVLFRLFPEASEADMIREAPSLVASERVYRGVVKSSTGTGLTDALMIGTREDWTGAVLTILSGTDAGSQYVVSAFDAAAGTLSYTHSVNPTAGDTFAVRRSYQPELDAAWDDVMDRLDQMCSSAPSEGGQKGSRPYLVMTPDRLKRPHLMRALEKAFRGIATDTNGVDWARAEVYAKGYEEAWNGMRLVFAFEGDMTAPTPEGERSPQWGFSR